ncbi:BTB domain-containing protein [Mycena kentingensis (nom. inval.)]|nr:BTB domain-containing protein [Mycena kentingensis (nom. inval.)]
MSTDSATPPAKRRREDDGDTSTPIERSSDYWFDDGNVILQVESTQFRLNKSMLARHSSVFTDLFTVPTPEDEPLVDGCPVVVLSGDTANDWRYLLSEIVPSRFRGTKRPTISLFAALLRLSKKYDFSEFRKECLYQLKYEFPTSWAKHTSNEGWRYLYYGDKTCVEVINLAREIGLYSILPSAFYHMTALSPECKNLSLADQLALAEGQIRILRLKGLTVTRWLFLSSDGDEPLLPCPECSTCQECTSALHRAAYHESCVSSTENDSGDREDVFIDWKTEWEDGLCSECVDVAQASFDEGRVECWNKLPLMFGLPDWEELKKMDFE